MSIFKRLTFSLWYYRHPPWDSGVSPPELLKFIRETPPGRALDLGCGTGTNAVTLAQSGWIVSGVDFAPRAIWQAKSKARSADLKIDFRIGDVTDLEASIGSFDLVLDIGCFHGLDPGEKARYLAALHRLITKDGTFLLYAVLGRNGNRNAFGLCDHDLEPLTPGFSLMSRQDGLNLGKAPSAWFEFRKI